MHVGTTEHAAAHVGADNVSSAKVVEVDGAAAKAPVGALVPLEPLHKLQRRRSIAREGHFELVNAVGDHHHDPHDGSHHGDPHDKREAVVSSGSRLRRLVHVHGRHREQRKLGAHALGPERAAMVRASMFGMYFLLLNLQDFDIGSGIKDALRHLKDENPALHRHLKKHTSKVEVARKRGGRWLVEYVHFHVDDNMLRLSASVIPI